MIKYLILSVFLLFSTGNLQSIENNFWYKSLTKASSPPNETKAQPINVKVINNKDDSNIYQILTILGGFVIMAFQVYWQQKGNLKLQQENSREKLKLTIYEKIDEALEIFFKSEISTYLRLMQTYLTQTYAELKMNSNLTPINSRIPDFLKYNETSSQTAIQVCFLLESWEIVSPQFKVFRLAINSALHDLRESFAELYPLLLHYLPVDLPIEKQVKTIWPHIPNEEQLLIIQKKIANYLHNYDLLAGYMYDIKISCQNNLLGNLFQHRIEFRKPLDPKFTAINFDTKSIEDWISHFENETAWGISCKAAALDVLTKNSTFGNTTK